jgi:hypothetical protein
MSVMAKSARPVTVVFDANWKSILECAAAEVFEMMAGVHLQQYSAPLEEPKSELTAMVGLAGALCGMTTVRCSQTASVKLASLMLGGGQRSEPGLQMSDPLAGLRHLRCGIRQQSGKKLHASQWIADLVGQNSGDFR